MVPARTASGVPIRYVNVPVPNFNNCAAQNNNAYNGARYGYGYSYGYGYGYGSSGYNSSYSLSGSNSQPLQRQAARAETQSQAPPDPRSARDYSHRKALEQFARDNSVGGRIYLTKDSRNWLLTYNGPPIYSADSARIPCLGKVSDGLEQAVILTIKFDGQDVVETILEPASF